MATESVTLPEGVAPWLDLFVKAKEEKSKQTGSPPEPNLDEFMKDENVSEFNRRYGVAKTVEGKKGEDPTKSEAVDHDTARLTLRIKDIVDYPPEHTSTAIQEIKDKVTRAHVALKFFTEPIDPDKAAKRLEALTKLEKELSDGVKVVQKHDAEMRKYFKALKALAPKINTAHKLDAVSGGSDNPWKAERLEYDTQKAKVIRAQDDHKYAEANTELKVLEEKITALLKKKTDEVKQEIVQATDVPNASAAKAKGVVDQLATNPGLISAMDAEDQLKLLEMLRTKVVFCSACDKGFEAKDVNANGGMCPTCASDANLTGPGCCTLCGTPGKPSGGSTCTYLCENKKGTGFECEGCGGACTQAEYEVDNSNCCNDFVDNANSECTLCFAGPWTTATCNKPCDNDKFKYDGRIEHEVNKEPSENQDLLQARATMFANMKMDDKYVAKEKETRKTLVKQFREDPKFKEAEENWATWAKSDIGKIQEFFNHFLKKQCELLGHDKPKGMNGDFPDIPVKVVLEDLEPSTFGDTSPTFPAVIRLNKQHRSFGDFKEMVDTLLHENSHAWQNMICAQMKKQAPFDDGSARTAILNNPDLKTQAEFFEENDLTYIPDAVNREAYRHEPLEEQAWTFGGSCSQALLVPPQVRDLKSSAGMKNKIWFIQSMSREAQAKVRLKQRHGIYTDEWEGEKAGDKKLTLEIPGQAPVNVQIVKMIDEYTLELNFNASAIPERDELAPDALDKELKPLAKSTYNKELTALTTEERKALIKQLVDLKGYLVEEGSGTTKYRMPESGRLVLNEKPSDLA